MSRNKQDAPVLLVGGSLGAGSATTILMTHTEKLLIERGFTCEVLGAAALELPMYHPDLHEHEAPEADALIAAFRRARAYVWFTPAYHYSISGRLKNALDYLELMADDDPPYLAGRLVGLVAASSGPIAAVHAIGAMEQIVHALRGYVVPATAPIGPIERAVDRKAGTIVDERTKLKLSQLADEMRDALLR
jgi:FMN reductase